jgi:hypothetical protein
MGKLLLKNSYIWTSSLNLGVVFKVFFCGSVLGFMWKFIWGQLGFMFGALYCNEVNLISK